MPTPHYKLDRKELKQPDEFITFLDQLGDFIVNNLVRVIIGALALIAFVVVFYAVSFYQDHQRRLASDRFYDALTALNHRDYKTAEQGFSSLATDNPRQSLGQLARLYLASALMADNNDKAARAALADYLAGSDQPLYRNMALMELGAADENLGDFKGAHDAYAQAADIDGPSKARAQVGVARTLIKQGDTKGGIEAYQQFLANNPYSPMRNYVVEALATLGVAIESHSSAPANAASAN
ncbi:MAG TPA: tetratricopeptide repeat protein [Candidatus Binataceae bacterium]|nr:tetratricopeptide repeat protein [Candidatus Binataceae bacterium]